LTSHRYKPNPMRTKTIPCLKEQIIGHKGHRNVIFCALLSALLLLGGCNSDRRQLLAEAPLLGDGMKDALGQPIHFREPPQRIVSLSAVQTMILYKLGLKDRLVARSETSNYP